MGLYTQKIRSTHADTRLQSTTVDASITNKTCMIMCPFRHPLRGRGVHGQGGGSHTLPTRATVGLTYLGLAVAGRASSSSTTSTANYYLLQALHRVAWKWRDVQSGRKPRRRAIFSSCVHVGVRVVDEARARVRVRVRAGARVRARVSDRVSFACCAARSAPYPRSSPDSHPNSTPSPSPLLCGALEVRVRVRVRVT